MPKTVGAKRPKIEDLQLAALYRDDNPHLGREKLGALLEKDGLGVGHHAHSNCYSRAEYINLILDAIFPE